MINRLLRFIQLSLWIPTIPSSESRKEEIAKKVVRRFSHGNIRLQRGEFCTEDDIKERYDRIKSFDFLR